MLTWGLGGFTQPSRYTVKDEMGGLGQELEGFNPNLPPRQLSPWLLSLVAVSSWGCRLNTVHVLVSYVACTCFVCGQHTVTGWTYCNCYINSVSVVIKTHRFKVLTEINGCLSSALNEVADVLLGRRGSRVRCGQQGTMERESIFCQFFTDGFCELLSKWSSLNDTIVSVTLLRLDYTAH